MLCILDMVSIVIVNYNTFELTVACIESVLNKTRDVEVEIILVDNGSTEGDPDRFRGLFPSITLVKSAENVGFARGCNMGIEKAKGEYILLLNSDTQIINNAIKICKDYLDANRHVGVVSAKLVYPDGSIQSVCQRFPRAKYKFIEFFRLHKLLSKQKRGELLLGSFFDHSRIMRCDWVWGAFFMLRASILCNLYLSRLNDEYFMYFEDMQWCWDIRRLGYEVHYVPQAEVLHWMGKSKGEKQSLMRKNYLHFINRNYSKIEAKLVQIADFMLSTKV